MKNSDSNVLAELNSPPVPGKNQCRLMVGLTKLVGEDPYQRFGTQLIRIASDMIAVCNEDLEILFHNKAFVRGMGYRDGSFKGQSLMSFFPADDQLAAESAFFGLGSGHAAGLRINASVLTKRRVSQFDIRVVKSRKQNGEFLYYLIARESVRPPRPPAKIESAVVKTTSFFEALPIAVWRTDKRLKIIDAEGSLWNDLGINVADLVGESIEDGSSVVIPDWFNRIDFCDTMAGRSSHLEVSNNSGEFDITIEPLLNKNNRIVGTVGFLRKSKSKVHQQAEVELKQMVSVGRVSISTSAIESMAPPTQDFVPRSAPVALPETKKVALPAIANALEKAKSSEMFQAQTSLKPVYPRPMTPPDLDGREKSKRQLGSTSETKAVALSR